MNLIFERTKVQELLAYELAGKPDNKPYTGKGWGCKGEKAHGLNLVGDQGVYLLANRKQKEAPAESGLIAYARGCNPDIDEFDDWWNNKRASFGGDDGAEFIPVEDIQQWLERNAKVDNEVFLVIDLTPDQLSLVTCSLKPKRKRKR